MTKEEVANWYEKTHKMQERAEIFLPDYSDIYITSVHYNPGIIGMKGTDSKYANPWVSISWRYNSWDREEAEKDVYYADELVHVPIDEFVDGWD